MYLTVVWCGWAFQETPPLWMRSLSHLPAASVTHFACHGQQDTRNPLESALILEDSRLKVSRIMQQSMPSVSLAFLCACETAMGDETLPDEAISSWCYPVVCWLSRSCVATMWWVRVGRFVIAFLIGCRSISDSDDPRIADTFYENLHGKQNHSTTTWYRSGCPSTPFGRRQIALWKRLLSYVGFRLSIWEGDLWCGIWRGPPVVDYYRQNRISAYRN